MSFTSKVRSWLSTIVRRACAKSTMNCLTKEGLEASPGIEPGYKDLQSSA